MEFEKQITTLAIEVTRRCNMNCAFCCKGDAQNMDITKEIIDKALDEWQAGVLVYVLRVSGGEPMLAPEIQIYLIDEIIRRKLPLTKMYVYTNATILDDDLREAYRRMSEYLLRIRSELKDYIEMFGTWFHEVFPSATDKVVNILLSTDEYHNNKDRIEKALEFYGAINEDCAVIDTVKDTLRGRRTPNLSLVIGGKAEQNYKTLWDKYNSNDVVQNLQILYNKYWLMYEGQRQEDKDIVLKTISISANGNVFPGCSASYSKVDGEYCMFNIMQCNGDFIEKIKEWSWEHPLYEKTISSVRIALTYQWAREHGVPYKKFGEEWEPFFARAMIMTRHFENIMKQTHKQWPMLKWAEVLEYSCRRLYYVHNKPNAFIGSKNMDVRDYLTSFARFDEEFVDLIAKTDSAEKMGAIKDYYNKINGQRAAERKGKNEK